MSRDTFKRAAARAGVTITRREFPVQDPIETYGHDWPDPTLWTLGDYACRRCGADSESVFTQRTACPGAPMPTPTETTVLSEEEMPSAESRAQAVRVLEGYLGAMHGKEMWAPDHLFCDAISCALSTIRTLQDQAEYWRRANEEMRPNLDRACAQRDSHHETIRTLQAREKRLREKVALLSLTLYGAIGTIHSVRELDNPEHQAALDAVLEESRAAGPMTSAEARTALSEADHA